MTRFVPHPLLTAALTMMWLLLTQFTIGNLLLGLAIALVAGWAMGALEPEMLRVRRPFTAIRLFFVVGWDIMRSNYAVARLILSRDRNGQRRSGFVHIPIRLKSEAALAVLAMIVTATPGTAWLDFDPDSGMLLIHVFDYLEDDDWQELIGNRYETLLLEIFE